MKFSEVKEKLKALNITIVRIPAYGEYRVNFVKGKESTAYYTDDLMDAYDTGIAMAKERDKR